jgi:hypothetical protein
MNTNWHELFGKANVKNDIYGKLKIESYYNEVIGWCLEVDIIDNNQKSILKVYGLNDGHRGQGWIHYNEKIELDLDTIYNQAMDELRVIEKNHELEMLEKAEKEKQRVTLILDNY